MANGNGGNDMPTEVLNLGQGWVLKLSRLLAEGGFSYVFLGEDSSPQVQHNLPQQQQLYAVKKMNVTTPLQKKAGLAEVDLIKQFNHPNIIQCITTHSSLKKHSSGSVEFLYIVMEYCSPLPKMAKNEQLVGNVFKQCVDGLEYCHSFGLSHRDIKLENFMIGPDGYVKLIDFGSASSDIIKPEIDWSSKQRSIVEEELATVTTPMYRAPEIVSLWENYIIDSRVDLWALGCTLYLMWFGTHPFPDSNKLAILNGKYALVEEEICSNFKKLITGLLQVNPEDRLSYNDIKRLLVDYQVVKLEYVRPVFDDPIVPVNLMNTLPQQAASTTKSLFSSIKVGAESLFKNIRDNYYNPPPPNARPTAPTQPVNQANRFAENQSMQPGPPPPPLPPKHHRDTAHEGNGNGHGGVPQQRRPPLPPSPTPPARPPKPISASQQAQYPSSLQQEREVVVDNLLNLGEDLSAGNLPGNLKNSNDIPQKRTDADLLADLFSSNVSTSTVKPANVAVPSLDLFSNTASTGFKSTPAAPTSNNSNLLDDIFGSAPSVVVGQEPIPPTTADTSNPTTTMPSSSSFTSLFLGGVLKPEELKKNVSSPNLTQLIGNGAATGSGLSGFDFDLNLTTKPSAKQNPTMSQKIENPNYSRSLFEDKPPPQPKQDLNAVFGEFLNDVGFTTTNKNAPVTMSELKMETNAKDLDPITISIRKWTKDGQNRKNIRALLSTLHTVTWPTCTWQEHPMSQMIQPIQVKKVYRKACLCIHPDKQVGTEFETLAKSIFIELNEAWSYFSQEEQ